MTETCPIHYWAQQTPEHIAVEAGAVRLSYRTLNRRVASLAQQLAGRAWCGACPFGSHPRVVAGRAAGSGLPAGRGGVLPAESGVSRGSAAGAGAADAGHPGVPAGK